MSREGVLPEFGYEHTGFRVLMAENADGFWQKFADHEQEMVAHSKLMRGDSQIGATQARKITDIEQKDNEIRAMERYYENFFRAMEQREIDKFRSDSPNRGR